MTDTSDVKTELSSGNLTGYDTSDKNYGSVTEPESNLNTEQQLGGGKKSRAKKPAKKTEKAVSQKKAQTTERKPNKWLLHVANVQAANPDMKYKDVLVHAKGTYIKS